MPTGEAKKKLCKKCRGMGHFSSYEPPRVVRRYCDCETGKKRKDYLEKLTKTKEDTLIWELLSI